MSSTNWVLEAVLAQIENWGLLPAVLRAAQPCRYCVYLVVQKWGFLPAGATHCPDNVYQGRNAGILPNPLKFRTLATNFPRRDSLHNFYKILMAFLRVF